MDLLQAFCDECVSMNFMHVFVYDFDGNTFSFLRWAYADSYEEQLSQQIIYNNKISETTNIKSVFSVSHVFATCSVKCETHSLEQLQYYYICLSKLLI